MKPMEGRACGCARAASGHVMAAQPTRPKNSRRLMIVPQARRLHATTSPETEGLRCTTQQIKTCHVRCGSFATDVADLACRLMSASLRKRQTSCSAAKCRDAPKADK